MLKINTLGALALVFIAFIAPVLGTASVSPVCTPKYQSKLSACPTGTSFCSSLLGETVGGSYTLTQTAYATVTNTTTVAESKGKSTSYVTTTMVIQTNTYTVTTVTTASVTTVTNPTGLIGSPTCTVSTVALPMRQVINVAQSVDAAKANCGVTNDAAASAACSCFIDPIVTRTSTKVVQKTITVASAPVETLTSFSTSKTTMTAVSTYAPSTSTVTLGPCPTPDSSCGNSGLEWSYTPSLAQCTCCANQCCSTGPYNPGNIGVFDPSLYKNVTPVLNGTAHLVSIDYTGNGAGNGSFYSIGNEPLSYYVINHRGYFYAPQTGNYTMYFNYVDDAGFIWLGAKAYAGWNFNNRDYYEYWGTNPTYSLTYYMVANTYVPFRVAYGQGCGAGGFGMVIVAPDGETMMQSSSGLTGVPYFVSKSCDGRAPAYPSFGRES